MIRPLFALLLCLTASAQAAQPVSATFYTRTGNTPACGTHRAAHPSTAPIQLAVSRDLLRTYPCGTRVGIRLARPIAGRWVITAVVSDTTGPRARNTIDILAPSRAQALRWGRVRATLWRLP